MLFEFATATRIVFGRGSSARVPALSRELGARALLVTGRPRGASAALREAIDASGLVVSHLAITAEPSVEDASAGAAAARASRCDIVVSLGGGSVIDAGKAIAALLANPGEPLDYLEVVGRGRPLERPSVPFVAIPTTAGSGAEVTRNAVLSSAAHGVKASLRSPFMLPRLAVVDPELTVDLPRALTAATGLDALAQLIEPYVSARANPLTDALCREGMVRVSACLRVAYSDGTRLEAREGMSLASLFGGLALANAGLGAVHGFAGPLGGRFAAPHGALCAALLPAVLRVNLAGLRSRSPGGERLARFEHVARLLTGRRDANAEEGIEWLESLAADLGVERLSAWGVRGDDIAGLVAQANASSSLRGNPIELTDGELAEILERAL
jgi:alcohol dehydrogenase class IV